MFRSSEKNTKANERGTIPRLSDRDLPGRTHVSCVLGMDRTFVRALSRLSREARLNHRWRKSRIDVSLCCCGGGTSSECDTRRLTHGVIIRGIDSAAFSSLSVIISRLVH